MAERTEDQKKFRELVDAAEERLFEKVAAYADGMMLTDEDVEEVFTSIYESELAEKYMNWVMD